MSKFLALILLLLFTPLTAQADTTDSVQWVRVTETDTILYAHADTTMAIFTLPQSYYLQVIDEQNNFYMVQYMANSEFFPTITGYVLTTEVEVCTEVPIAPLYPEVTIVVDSGSSSLHLSPLTSSNVIITATNTQTMSYYGTVTNNYGTWYYVCFCGQFGYISSDSVMPPDIALHPTPLFVPEPELPPATTPEPTDPEPTEPPPESTKVNTSEIVLICFVCLLAVGLVVALFLPSANKSNAVWDDQL